MAVWLLVAQRGPSARLGQLTAERVLLMRAVLHILAEAVVVGLRLRIEVRDALCNVVEGAIWQTYPAHYRVESVC